MPIYEYTCKVCGFEFEEVKGFNEPNPPCPALTGKDVSSNPQWRRFFTDAQRAFEAGRKVPYPAAPTFIDVGPDYPHTFIPLHGQPVTKTLGEWIAALKPCGGETQKLISSSSFHLKGTGWYKTDYGSS